MPTQTLKKIIKSGKEYQLIYSSNTNKYIISWNNLFTHIIREATIPNVLDEFNSKEKAMKYWESNIEKI
jgi:hypothetical protein